MYVIGERGNRVIVVLWNVDKSSFEYSAKLSRLNEPNSADKTLIMVPLKVTRKYFLLTLFC